MKDLSLHLLDILQNSISAGASIIEVVLAADIKTGFLLIRITDNGKGMDPQLAAQVDNPFITTRKTRKIGLGIPLLKASANLAGGNLQISSAAGEGTTVEATFRIVHIDRLPLGDIASTITNTIAAYPKIDILLKIDNEKDTFLMDTRQIKAKLREVPITEFDVLEWLKDFINEGVKITFGGVLNEITG